MFSIILFENGTKRNTDRLGWNRLGLHPREMMRVMKDREVWRLNLELLPSQPPRKSGQRREKETKKFEKAYHVQFSTPTWPCKKPSTFRPAPVRHYGVDETGHKYGVNHVSSELCPFSYRPGHNS